MQCILSKKLFLTLAESHSTNFSVKKKQRSNNNLSLIELPAVFRYLLGKVFDESLLIGDDVKLCADSVCSGFLVSSSAGCLPVFTSESAW